MQAKRPPPLRQDGQLRKRLKTKTLCCMHHLLRIFDKSPLALHWWTHWPILKARCLSALHSIQSSSITLPRGSIVPLSGSIIYSWVIARCSSDPSCQHRKLRVFWAPHSIQSLSMATSRGSIPPPPLFCICHNLIHADIQRFHNLPESPFSLYQWAYSPTPKAQRFTAPDPTQSSSKQLHSLV